MRIRHCLMALFAIWSLSFQAATAQVLQYEFFLDGPSESPPNASPGTGYALVTIDTDTSMMHVEAEFSGLIGTTTNAHIHCCQLSAQMTAGVATSLPTFPGFPSGVTSGTYDNTLDMTLASSYNPTFVTNNGGTTASAFSALLGGLASGDAYFNIHSSAFAGGEIRGFAQLVPEPASAVLAFLGLGIPVLLRRPR